MLFRIPTDYLQNLTEFPHESTEFLQHPEGLVTNPHGNFAESSANPHSVPYISSQDASESSKHRPRHVQTLTRRGGLRAANWDPPRRVPFWGLAMTAYRSRVPSSSRSRAPHGVLLASAKQTLTLRGPHKSQCSPRGLRTCILQYFLRPRAPEASRTRGR